MSTLILLHLSVKDNLKSSPLLYIYCNGLLRNNNSIRICKYNLIEQYTKFHASRHNAQTFNTLIARIVFHYCESRKYHEGKVRLCIGIWRNNTTNKSALRKPENSRSFCSHNVRQGTNEKSGIWKQPKGLVHIQVHYRILLQRYCYNSSPLIWTGTLLLIRWTLRSAIFRDIRQRRVLIPYRRFETAWSRNVGTELPLHAA
jgi:hypothetical protein